MDAGGQPPRNLWPLPARHHLKMIMCRPATPLLVAGRTHWSVTAETGREFDKLATHLTTPRDSPNPGVELGSQPQPDAHVN